ncbi:MAG TPA: YidB family protein [Rhizomicrobium sp.]|nr:YidB family protein [Rhizomicrobium sp.]
MGFLDDALGAAKGALLNGAEGGAQGILGNVLGNSSLGGVSGILGQLSQSGLGDLVSSWTGGGNGQPISVDQLKAALTPEHIQEIASSLGMSPDSALGHLAEHLPKLAGGQA